MARFDKYDPKDGGFRAPLGFAIAAEAVGTPVGVGIDANGVAMAGAGATGVVGVICPSSPMNVGDAVDVCTDGEIVDLTGFAAGDQLYAAVADGVISTTNTGTRLGFTVQAWRFVVRVAR